MMPAGLGLRAFLQQKPCRQNCACSCFGKRFCGVYMKRHLKRIIIGAIILAVFALVYLFNDGFKGKNDAAAKDFATVSLVRVVDGDTIVVKLDEDMLKDINLGLSVLTRRRVYIATRARIHRRANLRRSILRVSLRQGIRCIFSMTKNGRMYTDVRLHMCGWRIRLT